MRLSDFTYEVFQKIVDVYDRARRGRGSSTLISPEMLGRGIDELKMRRPVEWRFHGTKLWVEHVPFYETNSEEMLIRFRFDGDEALSKKEANRIEEVFNGEVTKFLTTRGLITGN